MNSSDNTKIEDLERIKLENEQLKQNFQKLQQDNQLKDKQLQELKLDFQQIQMRGWVKFFFVLNILRFDDLEQNNDQTMNKKLIEEYETNLNRASQETERIRNELAKFEEEKALHEKRTNLLIQSLKEECENMKNQG